MKHSVARKGKSPHRKKLRGGQVVVPVNPLETHVYVNFTVTGTTITSATTTDGRISTGTIGAGTIQLNLNPAGSTSVSAPPLTTLKNYSVFGYNGSDTKWTEIPREKLDMGGTTVALYGVEPNIHIRKQRDPNGKIIDGEISVPADINAFGGVLNFGNISDDIFGFTAAASPITTNVYIQLVFTLNYPTPDTKWSGWNPATVPGLSLWLDGVEPGLNGFTPNTGIPVPNWNDKSGKNNHGSSSSPPVYQSNPALTGTYKMGMYLNGTSAFMSGSIKNDMNYCATFSVVSPDAGTVLGRRIISLSAPGISDTAGTNIYTNVVYNSKPTPTNSLSFVGTLDSTIALSTTFVPIRAANSPFVVSSVVTNNGVISLANGANMFLCQGFISNGTSGTAGTILKITSAPPGVIYIDSTITGPYDFNTWLQTGTQVAANTLITDMSVITNGGVGTYTVNNSQTVGTTTVPVWFAVSNPIPGSTVPSRSNLNLSTYSIGKNNSGGDFFKGYVHEVLIYTRPVSKQGRQTIEGYLAWKWGLQANLHPRHPYRLVAPNAYSPSVSIPLMFPKIKPLLWLDAQDPQANDGTILPVPNMPLTGWYDKSGNDNHGVTITIFAPTYRPNSVVFNGTGVLKNVPSSGIPFTPFTTDTGGTDANVPLLGRIFRNCVGFSPNGNAVVSSCATGRLSNIINGISTPFASGLSSPSGIAFDSKGNMYVVEVTGHVIRRYSVEDNYATSVVIAGAQGVSGNVTERYVTAVTGYVAANILYVNSFTNTSGLTNPIIVGLTVVSGTDTPSRYHGTISSFGPNTNGGVGTYNLVGNTANVGGSSSTVTTIAVVGRRTVTPGGQARFSRPSDITIDKNDVIYICEGAGCKIMRIRLNPNSDPTIANNWSVDVIAGGWAANNRDYLGTGNTLSNSEGNNNGIPGELSSFNLPISITVDPTATFLYMGEDTTNYFIRIRISTRYVDRILVTQLKTVTGICCDELGVVYVYGIFNCISKACGVIAVSPESMQFYQISTNSLVSTSYSCLTYYNNRLYVCKSGNPINEFYSLPVPRPTYLYSLLTTPMSNFANIFIVCTNSAYNTNVTNIFSLGSASNKGTYTAAQTMGGGSSAVLAGIPILGEEAGPSSSYIGIYNHSDTTLLRAVVRKHISARSSSAYVTNIPTTAATSVTRPPNLLYASSNTTSIMLRTNGNSQSFPSTYLPFNIGSYGIGLQPSNIRRIAELLRTNWNSAMNYSFDGYVYEVIVYMDEMSENQYKMMEAYLCWKWSIPLTDTTNPFFTSATTPPNAPVNYYDTVPTPITNMVFSDINTNCVFTGSISGTTLTVTAITSGTIQIGATINTTLGGTITAYVSGTMGGVAVYTVSVSQTVASGTITASRNFSGVFRGSITGTTLTVTSIVSGRIYIGATIHTPTAVTISAFVSGTNGGIGQYTVSSTQTVAAGTLITSSVAFTLSWRGGLQATNYTYALSQGNSVGNNVQTTQPTANNGVMLNSISYTTGITRASHYYTITVTPRNIVGAGTAGIAIIVQTPALPTRTAPSLTGFTVNITAVTAASSYRIYLNEVRYGQITSGTTLAVTNLPSGATYFVTATAVSSTGHETPPSTILVARTLPTAPSNIVISNWVAGGFTLSWSGAIGATSYTFTGATPTTLPQVVNGVLSKSANFTGLTSTTAYTITITSVNVGSENSPTAGTITIPVAPILTSNSVQQTQFTLAFTTVTGASSYNVYVNGIRWTSTTISPSATIINGQPQGAILYITVAAVINATEMWPSPVLIVALTLPPLTNFSSSNMTTNSFRLNWLGGDGSTSYLYSFGSATPLTFTDSVSNKNVTFTGGDSATTYVIYVQGRNLVGNELSTTGSTITVTGSITTTTLTVTAVPSGTVPLGGFVHTPTGGVITSSGTGGTGTYTISVSQTVASQPIKISSTNIITIWRRATITYNNGPAVLSENGLGIELSDVSGPTRCNIYVSSDFGNTYSLLLSNQVYTNNVATQRRYNVNTVSLFIGTIAANVLTVTSITSGRVYKNAFLNTPRGVKITGFLSGTNGGIGTYSVSTSPNVSTQTTFTARTSGLNLYIISKFLDSNGVEGWATNPVFQRQLPPSTPYDFVVTFPNMVTSQNTPTISWSGGDGAGNYVFNNISPTSPNLNVNGKSYSCTFSDRDRKSINIIATTGLGESPTVNLIIPAGPSSMGGMIIGTIRRARELNFWFNPISNITRYNIYVNGVFNRETTTPTNTLITLPAGTGTALINVRAIDAAGNEGFPSPTFTSTLLAPTAPVIGTITGTLAGGFVMPWTGADTAETITIAYTSGTGPPPTIDLVAKTATFTGLSARSIYVGTIVANSISGSSTAVNWSFNTYIISTYASNIFPAEDLEHMTSVGRGIAVDSSNNIYIPSNRNTILKYTVSTGNITIFAGMDGVYSFSGDTGPATSASLRNALGVTVDSSDNVYIADTGNHRIRKVTAADGKINTIIGGTNGGFAGDGLLATNNTVRLYNPSHVAIDNTTGNIYIADCSNHRIRKFTAADGKINTLTGNGTYQTLSYPRQLVLDSSNNVYIPESYLRYDIRKFVSDQSSPFANQLTIFAGQSSRGYSGDNGPATSALFNSPVAVAIDSRQNVFIVDMADSVIRVVLPNGKIYTIAGAYQNAGSSGDGGPASSATLNMPCGITVDSNNNIYILDLLNNSIRKLS